MRLFWPRANHKVHSTYTEICLIWRYISSAIILFLFSFFACHLLLIQRQENFPSSSSKDEKPTLFGDKQLRTNNYFGGPLFEKVDLKWRETFYTRARGDIIGADDAKIPQPHNLKQIIRSVAVLQSRKMSQSALWVGPRFLISALHLFNWPGNVPTTQQCELLRLDGTTFHVESEITSSILSSNSPKVQLIAFSAENDLGVFKLQDQYPPSSDWIDLDLLMDRDEAAQMNIRSGSKVACIGYSGQIDTLDAKQITWEMAIQLRHKVPAASFEVSFLEIREFKIQLLIQIQPLNFDTLTKSQMKSFAPGTLDNARINDGLLLYGVSASLWKGSSGGPCVLLDGSENGRIIGLGEKTFFSVTKLKVTVAYL